MSASRIPASIRAQVKERANFRCEYCQIQDHIGFFAFHIDHIISTKHDGTNEFDNLAYSCPRCNQRKGADIGIFSLETGKVISLYHPRKQNFVDHFEFRGNEIIGLTDLGKSMVKFLKLNSPERLIERSIGL